VLLRNSTEISSGNEKFNKEIIKVGKKSFISNLSKFLNIESKVSINTFLYKNKSL
jgi:hypothetical protein